MEKEHLIKITREVCKSYKNSEDLSQDVVTFLLQKDLSNYNENQIKRAIHNKIISIYRAGMADKRDSKRIINMEASQPYTSKIIENLAIKLFFESLTKEELSTIEDKLSGKPDYYKLRKLRTKLNQFIGDNND